MQNLIQSVFLGKKMWGFMTKKSDNLKWENTEIPSVENDENDECFAP